MSTRMSSQAETVLNVRVVVGKPQPNGALKVRIDKRFKNTATRLMTESICNYIAGAENTYKRGKGRPNYVGIGTMGITKQPADASSAAQVAPNFEDTIYVEGETTRPWFESTSIALSTVCGPVNTDSQGNNLHFWDPSMGWGKNGFTGAASTEPIFQGELCTMLAHNASAGDDSEPIYDDIERISILRADVLSDCPADWDYGVEGYGSQTIFYAYASVEWVHNLLKPSYSAKDPVTGEIVKHPVGPQLEKMAVSEFGLYEKTNTDPHGADTMLAGFRVPHEEDIVYVYDGEVILIEWRVIVRAVMPNEQVSIATEPAPTGLNIYAEYLGENASQDKQVQFTGVVRGPAGVRQGITWSIDDNPNYDANTSIDERGLLTIGKNEAESVVYVTGASIVDPFTLSKTAVLTGLIKNFVTGINLTTESIDAFTIQFRATVLGRGTFSPNVHWAMTGAESPATTISQTGLLTMDFEETSDQFKVTATSVEDSRLYSVAAVVRIDKTAGTYVISDFTILTEGGE